MMGDDTKWAGMNEQGREGMTSTKRRTYFVTLKASSDCVFIMFFWGNHKKGKRVLFLQGTKKRGI